MLADTDTFTGWKEQAQDLPPARVYGIMRLALAILAQALRDANKQTVIGDLARVWLLSPDAEPYLFLAGIEPGAVKSWIQAGARIPSRKFSRINGDKTE